MNVPRVTIFPGVCEWMGRRHSAVASLRFSGRGARSMNEGGVRGGGRYWYTTGRCVSCEETP